MTAVSPVIAPLNLRRPWLALVYGLATMVVPALHDHGGRSEGPAAIALAGCDDPGTHYAGHGAPEILRGELHCPACQHRVEHEPVAGFVGVGRLDARSLPLPAPAPALRPRPHARPTGRSPPLA